MRIGIDARKIADFGIGTYIRGLLGGLVALDNGDELVAFAPASAAIPARIEHIVVDAPHYSARELITLGRAANRAKLDVFHAPHYVVPFTRVPIVVTIHDLIHLHQRMRNPLAPLYARAMLRRAVKRARCVLTVTETVKAQLETELGAKNVIVTPNGVTIPATADRRLPTADSFPDYFLYVGNDKPHKNVDTLIDAFARVRSEIPDIRLVLAGGAFERFRTRDGVEARGFVSDDELSALYRSAIALVMPSIEEGFGLPAAEAMAHGTAVIASTAPALVEVTGEAALHIDARDPSALASAMLRVARDGDLRAMLGANGIERARFFTWKRCAELTRDAYRIAAS
ncbi:MAG: glycosyltransferase family 4 protein [Acidobacteriota bacterium]|nr:glycosyltransferase family 4 protein [Acidobacteriota bacterium]